MPDQPRRERRRRNFKIKDPDIALRVIKFKDDDDTARDAEKQARIQRYAKYRMYTEEKDWPWPNSSNIPLPDMTEKSLRIQDTLHNAVMSSRPTIGAKAVDGRNRGKEETINRLIDVQVFVEQRGESFIGDVADAFVNEGVFTVFVPWVKEMRRNSDAQVFPPIPEEIQPVGYFQALLRNEFPSAQAPIPRRDGWDWEIVQDGERIEVSFYTKADGRVEMITKRQVTVYDGPKLIQLEWDAVFYPARAANLQIPGPSNPHGASHVVVEDHPTVDEIRKLWKDGVYDRLKKKDIDALEVAAGTFTNQEMKDEKDDIQGVTADPPDQKRTPSHKTVTRLTCFDRYDVDGDGLDEDVVWWVIEDTKILARAKLLSEVFPSRIPRRPLAGESFIPIRGRYSGISILELLEGLHDSMKFMLDQTVDAGTLANMPFGAYRPSGSIKPEIMHISPGELIPLQDPQRDMFFPRFGNRDQTFGLNILTMLEQKEDRLSTIGDLQLGGVPKGKSSALRTLGGMQLIAAQGEARPERILRRFFLGLTDIWNLIHEANQHFLSDTKKIRVVGLKSKSEDPYQDIDKSDIEGAYNFEFKANVLNTSKMALQQSYEALMGTYVSEIAIQLGIIDPVGIYKLFRGYGESHGQDPDQFLTEPAPGSLRPRIWSEDALATIMDLQIPDGEPAEGGGAMEHLQKLQQFIASDENYGLFTEEMNKILGAYIKQTMEKAAMQQRQQAAAAAAGQFGGNGGSPGAPPQGPPPDSQAAPLQDGQLSDMSLPGAGGGANVQ